MDEFRAQSNVLLVYGTVELQINWKDLIDVIEIVDFVCIAFLEGRRV